MSRRPVVRNVSPPPAPPVFARMIVGEVMGKLPGSSRISVRPALGSGRSIQNVIVAGGVNFEAGDRVLLVRVPAETAWIALAKVRDTYEYGNEITEGEGAQNMHPPSNFAVAAYTDLILVEWEGWSGDTLCFEVQNNSSAAESDSSNFYTRGSYYIYPVPVEPLTRYFRVRTVRYNVTAGVAYYSGWTDWSSATAPGPHMANAIQQLEFDEFMTKHVMEGA